MFGPAASTTADLAAMLAAVSSLTDATDDSERIDRIRLLEQLKGAAAAAQARETAAFAASRRAEHADLGTEPEYVNRDIAGQVALARRISPHQARRYVGFATILTTELPATYRLLRRGATSEWRAVLVARHTIFLSREHRFEVDRLMAPRLAELGDKRVEAEARQHAYRLDPQGYVDRARAAENDRRVGIRPAPDTMVWLGALLPVAQGVAAYATLSKHADERRAAGDSRSRGQIMADAFAERILGHATNETPIELELVMTDRALLPSRSGESEPAWLVGYGPLPAGYARSLILDTPDTTPRWIRRLFTAPRTGQLTAMDSRRRLFTPPQRHFVRLRDQYCRTKWCEAPIRHTDHVQAHQAGGATEVSNAQGLCEACNQTKQAPGWRTTAAADGDIETTTPTGHRYRSPSPPPPGRVRPHVGPVDWHFAAIVDRGRRAA